MIGRGRAGASNAKAIGEASARLAIETAIAGAFEDAGRERAAAASACFGIAGFGQPDDQATLRRWAEESRWADRLTLVTDGDLVVAAGTPEGVGVGVIAGTGSIAVGRAADGRTARAGGWGFLMGDEGSAYAVALAALRLVARRADGRDPGQGALTDRICRRLGVANPAGIVGVIYAPGFDRTAMAALAPEVLAAADDGDTEIIDLILQPAGWALAEQARAVALALDWTSGALPLALAGGFLVAAPRVYQTLVDDLTAQGYQVLAKAVTEPVAGAIVLAERALE